MMMRLITLGLTATGTFMLVYFGLYERKEPETRRIFTSEEIVWYGMDFTKAHFVGTFDQGSGFDPADGEALVTKWIPAWNDLVEAEKMNFNLKQAFRKRHVYYDMGSVYQLNKKIDPELLLSYKETKISKATIREMVKRYTNNEKKEGIGLVFIIENFNKNSKTTGLYVTFFDIETKKVLITEFMSGNPVGFGLRNYWAGAIKDVLIWVELYEYNKWKSKYYNKPADEESEEAISSILKNNKVLLGQYQMRHFD